MITLVKFRDTDDLTVFVNPEYIAAIQVVTLEESNPTTLILLLSGEKISVKSHIDDVIGSVKEEMKRAPK